MTMNRRLLLAGASASTGFVAFRSLAQGDARPTLEAYAKSPAIDDISLSPDGTKVLMLSQKGDEKIMMQHNLLSGETYVYPLGKHKVRSIDWADNERALLTISRTTALDGFGRFNQEFFQALVIDMRINSARLLFEHEIGFYDIVMSVERIKTAKGYKLIASNYALRQNDQIVLYEFDPATMKSNLWTNLTDRTSNYILNEEGMVLGYSEFKYDGGVREWSLWFNTKLDSKAGTYKKVYTFSDKIENPGLVGLGRDGKTLVIIEPQVDGFEYYEIDENGKKTLITDESEQDGVASALLHPLTGRFAGFSHHADWFSYDYIDPKLKEIDQAIREELGPDVRYKIAARCEDIRKFIVKIESADTAGVYLFMDFSTGEHKIISTLYPGLPKAFINHKKAIDYKAADGKSIRAYLTVPQDRVAKNLPLVVLPHGGPQARDYIDFDWQAQALASRGFAVLQPNFRGSDGYGAAFVKAGYGEIGRKMQTDLSDGVRHLVSQGLVDAKRVAIMGASYGGYAALAGATLDTGVYRCAVAISALSDPKTFVDYIAIAKSGYYGASTLYWKRFLGDPTTYDAISPVKQAAKASCPILILHGTDDTVVPLSQANLMQKALQAAGKPHEFKLYKGQDHWESIETDRIDMIKTAVAFIERQMKA